MQNRTRNFLYVPVAQLDRVSDSDSDGCRFESCQAHQNECSHGIEMSVEHSFFVSSAKRGNAKVNRVKSGRYADERKLSCCGIPQND